MKGLKLKIIAVLGVICVASAITSCASSDKNSEEIDSSVVSLESENGSEQPSAFSKGLSYTVSSDGKTCTVTGIGSCADTELIIPSRTPEGHFVTSIGDSAFSDCVWLASITIPSSVTSIGRDAFIGCSGLESITVAPDNKVFSDAGNCLIEIESKRLLLGCNKSVIPADGSVTSIGTGAFYDCGGLISITIPNSITSIGNSAFYGCSGLTSITIPDSVTYIGQWAFYGCSGLESIVVESVNPKFHSDGNCLIETKSKILVAGCKNSIIPADGSVTSIGDFAFYSCGGLTSITIPDSVVSIGHSAFSGCSGLASITIGNGVTSIDAFAFSECGGLTDITIPNSTTSIGDSAFYNCSGLISITVSDSVTSIGHNAFKGCGGLETVYYVGTLEQWDCVSIDINNRELTSASRYYYSESEPNLNADGTAYDGNYWRYDKNGNVAIWDF